MLITFSKVDELKYLKSLMVSFFVLETRIYLAASENITSFQHNKNIYTWNFSMQERVNDFLPLQLEIFLSLSTIHYRFLFLKQCTLTDLGMNFMHLTLYNRIFRSIFCQFIEITLLCVCEIISSIALLFIIPTNLILKIYTWEN